MADGERQFLNGKFLRDRRELAGVSLSKLAARSGIAKGHLSTIETGQRHKLGADLVEPLAIAYGLSEAELLLGLYGVTPENPTLVEGDAALRIGRQVLSIDPSIRKTLVELIEKMAGEQPNDPQAS